MRVQDVIVRVQRLFGDDNEAQVKVEDIIRWSNDAQLEVVRQTECLAATKLYDYSAGSNDFALPSDFIFEKRVSWNGKKLLKTSIDEIDLMTPDPTAGNTDPYWFYFWGASLRVYPVPNASATQALQLDYIQAPVELKTGTDNLQVPIALQEDVVRICLARVQEMNENYQASKLLSESVQTRLAESRFDQANRGAESYPVIKTDPGDLW